MGDENEQEEFLALRKFSSLSVGDRLEPVSVIQVK
jgi:hypothetical protein